MKSSILHVLTALAGLALFLFILSLPPSWWEGQLRRGTGETVKILVRPGMNARQAAEEFAAGGAVEKDRTAELARWMSRFGIDRKLRPGTYSLEKGSPWEVARQLERAEPSFASVVLVPGTDRYSFGTLLPGFSNSPDDLEKELSADGNFPAPLRAILPKDWEGRLAFLLPETYHMAEATASALISASSSLWWDRVGNLLSRERRTPQEAAPLAVVASLVEREAFRDEERPRIAGVIRNRREKGMPLQIDATVVYAWKKTGRNVTRVLYKDLEIESPYNTYRISGLPPGPICIPSEKSWLAALSPEKNEYLYYVAREDGSHIFAKTYSEHVKNIRKARGK